MQQIHLQAKLLINTRENVFYFVILICEQSNCQHQKFPSQDMTFAKSIECADVCCVCMQSNENCLSPITSLPRYDIHMVENSSF